VNGVGPHLYGVVGREIASVEAYSYSDALSSKEGVWDLDTLMRWLGAPGEFAPGNKMGYALTDEQDRIDVITYMNEEGPEPIELGAAGGDGGSQQAAAGDGGTDTASADDGSSDASGGDDTAAADEAAGSDDQAASGEASGSGDQAAADTGGDGTEMAAADATAEGPSGGDGPWAAELAAADAEAGKKVFNRCRACHKVEDGVNGVGPHLHDVIGREIAGVDGYSYSDALASIDGVWDLETMMNWLEKPGEFAPGNKMGFALRDAQDRVNVITYLNEVDGSPEPLQ
jgi:cytochrome c2